MKTCFVITSMLFAFCVEAQSDSLMREQKMDSLIRKGDDFFAGCDEDSAKHYYALAMEFRHFGNGHKQAHIEEQRKEMQFPEWCMEDNRYKETIKRADAAFVKSDFIKAKHYYNEALAYRPGEQYPKDQLAICDANIAKLPLENKYAPCILTADSLFKAGNYSEARSHYEIARKLKPNEIYPQDQIIRCDHAIRALQLDQQFKREMATGDSLFTLKKYAEAKNAYMRAIAINPGDPRPPQQIKKCDELLKED